MIFDYSTLKKVSFAISVLTLCHCSSDENTEAPARPEQVVKNEPQTLDETVTNVSPSVVEEKDAGSKLSVTPSSNDEQDKSFSSDELMYLTGTTATSSQQAYSHCSDVLKSAIYNRYNTSISESAKHAMKQEFCSLDEAAASQKVFEYLQQKESGSNSSSANASANLDYFDYFSASGSGGASNSSSHNEEVTMANARELADSWRKNHCGGIDKASSNSFVHTVLSENIDENVVNAWKSCVTQKHQGFFCSAKEVDDTVSVNIQWMPNQIQAKLLPKVNLTYRTEHNLDLISKEQPISLGTGSGHSVSYQKRDQFSNAILEIEAHDEGNNVTFVCSLQIPKAVRGDVKRHESCGVEEFVEKRDPECGVERYNFNTGKVCGAPTYNTLRTEACGVELYNREKSMICPGSIKADTKTFTGCKGFCYDVKTKKRAESKAAKCPSGYKETSYTTKTFDGGILGESITETRICYRAAKEESCRKSEFGVAMYKACAHPDNGIKAYPGCRHQDFGVELFASCRKASFGIAKYKSCFVAQ